MGKSFYASVNAVVLTVSRSLAVLGFVVLAMMAIWILIDVISGIFNWGLPGMVDWVEILNVICIALPLSFVTLQRRHISMTLIHEQLSDKRKHILDMIILVGMFLYSALLAWRVSIEAWYSLKMWERNDVGMVVYWFPAKIGLAFGLIMMTLTVMIQFVAAVSKKRGESRGQE